MLSNWRPSGGRRGFARLFDRKYRNDHSISLSSGKLRADLPKIKIPAEGRTWRQSYAQSTTIVALSLGPGCGEILRNGAIATHETVVAPQRYPGAQELLTQVETSQLDFSLHGRAVSCFDSWVSGMVLLGLRAN